MIRSKGWFIWMTVLVTASMLVTPTVQAAPETPYYGKDYSQTEQVQALYPDPDQRFDTPAFTSGKQRFTSQEEMLAYLHKLDRKTPWTKLTIFGHSQDGRALPALFYQKGSGKGKPTVWLQGQIHGNEPAAGEAVLATAKRLAGAEGKKLLNHINVVVVPRVNPDGSYAFQRHMADDLDGNRDHMKFDTPEVQALHSLYNRVQPEVTIDAHEYNPDPKLLRDVGKEGALKYHDLLILSGKNLNIPDEIRTFADETMVANAKETLTEKGFSSGDYYTAANKNGQLEITEGGPDPRIGRNNLALKPSLSFLVETRGIGIGRENFLRRVSAQVTTHQSLLESAAAHADQIEEMVGDARQSLVDKGRTAGDDDELIVKSEAKEIPNSTLPVVDIAEAKIKQIPVRFFSHSDGEATLTRERPTAYFLEPEQQDAVERLKNAGVNVKRLKKETTLPVETYTVTSKETADQPYEGHPQHEVTTDIIEQTITLPKGSWMIPMDQPTANLAALAMEPESTDSYVTFGFIPSKEGETLPIYRYMEERDW
ncbi:MAG: M14 family metallopeptidase [Firmicutes bacterium]|uniref:Zinc carboxypeptidase n=1 Tax=Melghirimyces thermohalophilus TaxID=1236220 RepID=A0A1G6QKT1_9BACL|nr:M14 family metallopeptidase [Melghirimyces thermohalophilus]MDA8353971.1 M14 family metallopeptidase [Bacillota bacterium]SDC93039.1 Zinc carboxypeptidase [Melghirimyces thermohalophilus]